MDRLHAMIRPLVPASPEPALAQAQLAALRNQVPLLYVILAVNSTAVAYTHVGVAPDAITIYPLAGLLLLCGVRLAVWIRRGDEPVSDAQAAACLRTTTRLAVLLAAGFLSWGLSLASYGDAFAQVHALFYIATTMIACVFCLMHLRIAALSVAAIVIVPFSLCYVGSGHAVLTAIALNLLIVGGVMVFVVIGYSSDFTRLIGQRAELERLSRENLRLANIDLLTGLPNRRSFFASLDRATAEGHPDGPPGPVPAFIVGMVDLDGFKPVNDTHGHVAGDAVLRETARRLAAVAREGDVVARLGGDEFGLILRCTTDAAAIEGRGESLRAALAAPFDLPNGARTQIEASIGFAIFPEAGRAAAVLIERADYALYYAKAHRRGAAILFTEEHETRLRTQSVIEQALRHADLDGEFSLMFQPLVDVATGRTVAFEALARWTSPALGPVSPAVFIPIAERSGQINRITEVLLAKALAAVHAWPDPVALSFNLSMADIASPQAVARVVAIIRDSGVPPRRIDLEATETALIRDFAQAQGVLAALKALGVGIALDDFGTGFSSLSYVHRLPIDKLKIDRSFTSEVVHDQACRDIVKSIIDLSRNLKLACVVEGIETEEQARLLESLGCFIMQGYHFHRPMGFSDTLRYLEGQSTSAGPRIQAVA
ncbi:hypothetical protein OPKNFCMD_5120 [Methylobacterium crusticola]|uniref:EAL domain-containing protein n=1 Tax=Methylobacterium crusticola TaxID=1697972 RepID=A0ABQ4R5D7_9HYPH|nr:EAL domain-containing protein [Methylobacterium crusticola]GJD52355.1 hypothetical protein OPKNFCMD_5120 [Methylobacterium crusticola]